MNPKYKLKKRNYKNSGVVILLDLKVSCAVGEMYTGWDSFPLREEAAQCLGEGEIYMSRDKRNLLWKNVYVWQNCIQGCIYWMKLTLKCW